VVRHNASLAVASLRLGPWPTRPLRSIGCSFRLTRIRSPACRTWARCMPLGAASDGFVRAL